MSVRNLLGLPARERSTRPGDSETVRRIARQLAAMDPDEARYVAAFAFILSRVARADSRISVEETREMERTIAFWGRLSAAQAVLVVEIAKAQSALLGDSEDSLVIAQFKSMSLPVQRQELLHCLLALSAVDDSISQAEESLVQQIASELGLSERDYEDIRSSYQDKRSQLGRGRDRDMSLAREPERS